jgi:hypothetical protein
LTHTGALIDGYRPLDLEVEYFDTSIPVASVVLAALDLPVPRATFPTSHTLLGDSRR